MNHKAWVQAQSASATEKSILAAVAECADGLNPSINYLAKKTKLCRRTVIRAVKALEARGLLQVARQRDARGGSLASSYHLPLVTPPGDKCHPPRGDKCHSPLVTNVTPPGDTVSPPPPTPGFDEFWAAYPRKEGKLLARKAFDRLEPSLLGVIVADLRRRYVHVEACYIPHPTTYLNQRRWEDEHRPPVERGRAPHSPGMAYLKRCYQEALANERKRRDSDPRPHQGSLVKAAER